MFFCIICQNLVNKETGYNCSVCQKPVCHKCYKENFLKSEDAQQYEMPCQCPLAQKLPMYHLYHDFQPIFQLLKFKCFISDDCPQSLSYEDYLNPMEHFKACNYVSLKCLQCNKILYKKDLASHRYTQACPERTMKCDLCQK